MAQTPKATIILLNKPFNVLSQFTDKEGRATLADSLPKTVRGQCYPAGRLDYDSEGLILLTDNGDMQHRISDPKHKLIKTYWAQVEGIPDIDAINQLKSGVELKDGMTKPASAKLIETPKIWPRTPPIRKRDNIPTSWIELSISEGKNRQVRRMTAAVGFPTLRLIRKSIGPWKVDNLLPGEYHIETVNMPIKNKQRINSSNSRNSYSRKRRS